MPLVPIFSSAALGTTGKLSVTSDPDHLNGTNSGPAFFTGPFPRFTGIARESMNRSIAAGTAAPCHAQLTATTLEPVAKALYLPLAPFRSFAFASKPNQIGRAHV